MDCFDRMAPLALGAQGVVYDGALRGVHHQVLMREHGLIPVNKVAASVKGSKKPRRSEGRRVEKSAFVDRKQVKLQNGRTTDVQLFAKGGAIGVGEITETGDVEFVELERTRTYRRGSKGRFRFYNEYRLPESFGVGTVKVTVRLHGDKEDTKRRFNRAENVRVIPPTDPDFKALYHRRNDAESINRGLVDTLYLGRAHSIGHARQLVNLPGYALTVNALALHQHRRCRGALTQAA